MGEKSTERALTPRQRAFVEAVASPIDGRSIADKSRAVGFTALYGYRLARRSHVAAAIETRTREHVQLLRARVGRILSALASKAEDGDTAAAKLFLEAAGVIGDGGVSVVNNVTATTAPANESLEDRIRRLTDSTTDEGRSLRIEQARASRLPERLRGIGTVDHEGEEN